jgi:hypothetical protein
MSENNIQKNLTYFIGAAAGLFVGLAAAYLLIKNQESNPDQKSMISSKDGLKIGVGLANLLKQIADIGKIQ